jgi:epoxide hydrolase-like predicted phosphatase
MINLGDMLPVKAFIFDFGGVLYRNPEMDWMRRWQKRLGLQDDAMMNAFLDSPEENPYMIDVMSGKTSEDELYRIAAERYHISPMIMRYIRRKAFSKKRENAELVRFMAELRPRFKTAILSNASDGARKLFTRTFGLDQHVDTIVISAEEGMAKPDERIYWLVLDRLGVRPEEAVFVDDRRVNVEAAQRLGMHAVQFCDPQQALAELKAYL